MQVAHYTAVAEHISTPIMYYNLPSASGVTLDAGQFRELRRAARVTSLKDTGGDAVAATELVQAGEDVPSLLNGWDTLTFAALAAGVRAVVWGTASILPDQCVRLHRLLIDEIDLPAARDLWTRLWPLCSFLPREAELLGGGQGRLCAGRRHDGPDPRAAARPRRRREIRADPASRADRRAFRGHGEGLAISTTDRAQEYVGASEAALAIDDAWAGFRRAEAKANAERLIECAPRQGTLRDDFVVGDLDPDRQRRLPAGQPRCRTPGVDALRGADPRGSPRCSAPGCRARVPEPVDSSPAHQGMLGPVAPERTLG